MKITRFPWHWRLNSCLPIYHFAAYQFASLREIILVQGTFSGNSDSGPLPSSCWIQGQSRDNEDEQDEVSAGHVSGKFGKLERTSCPVILSWSESCWVSFCMYSLSICPLQVGPGRRGPSNMCCLRSVLESLQKGKSEKPSECKQVDPGLVVHHLLALFVECRRFSHLDNTRSFYSTRILYYTEIIYYTKTLWHETVNYSHYSDELMASLG